MKIRNVLLISLVLASMILTACQPSPVAPTALTLTGPKSGASGKTYEFLVSADPVTATQPLKFTWQASGQSPVITTGNLTSTASFAWPISGLQTITVTAENGAGTITKKFDFSVAIAVPDAPTEALNLFTDKQKEVTSEHVDLALTLAIQATGLKSDPSNPSSSMITGLLKKFNANVTIGGDVDIAKNDFNLTGSADIGELTALVAQGADKITFDLIKVDDTMYSRVMTITWTSSPASTKPSSTASVTSTQAMAQIAEVIKNAAKAEKLADESIGGLNTYHYRVTLDAVKLIDQLVAVAQANASTGSTPPDPAQIQQAKDLLKDSVLELDMWVGQDDLYVRQVSFHINLNLKSIPDNPGATALVDFLIKATMTNVNKPVTIVAPK